MVLWQLVPAGRAVVVSEQGLPVLHVGPCKLSRLRDLVEAECFVATANEFLLVTLLTGEVQLRRGPAAAWFDPSTMKEVQIHKATRLEDDELVVVYRPEEDGVVRHLVRGPQLYFPQNFLEWKHTFNWSTFVEGRVQRSASKFQKLQLHELTSFYDVDARSSDGAPVSAKLVLRTRIEDPELLLKFTDPVQHILTALTADVARFCEKRCIEAVLQSALALGDRRIYDDALELVNELGIELITVSCRGFRAALQLQRACDVAVERRATLRSEADLFAAEQQQAMEKAAVSVEIASAEHKAKRERDEDLRAGYEKRARTHLLAKIELHDEELRFNARKLALTRAI